MWQAQRLLSFSLALMSILIDYSSITMVDGQEMPSPITAPLQINVSSTSDFKCFNHLQYRALAIATNCFQAINQLPTSGLTYTFHRALRPDRSNLRELPRTEVSGSCKVTVDLAFVREEQSSWFAIKYAAQGLINHCQWRDRTGGVVDNGVHKGLRIALGNKQAISVLDMGNATDGGFVGDT